jgi:outer membrane lipoprotein-sorting protein
MKRIFLLPLIIFTFTSLFGQVDQKAKSILDQVSEKTSNYKSISANFEFIMENSQVDLKESNQGTIILQGEQYVLTVSGFEIYNDSETQWTYLKDANEVNVTDAGMDDEGMINPATIFTIYEKGFNYSYIGEATENGKLVHKIDLVPEKIDDFSRVILNIDKSNLHIAEACMFGTDGNKYRIVVKNMNTSKSYPASTFKFDENKHPGVSVIDMR